MLTSYNAHEQKATIFPIVSSNYLALPPDPIS
jgi:hypothetical protein